MLKVLETTEILWDMVHAYHYTFLNDMYTLRDLEDDSICAVHYKVQRTDESLLEVAVDINFTGDVYRVWTREGWENEGELWYLLTEYPIQDIGGRIL